jgi:hypothetical protein
MNTHHDLDNIACFQNGEILVRRHGGEVGDDFVDGKGGGEGDSFRYGSLFGSVDGGGLRDDESVTPGGKQGGGGREQREDEWEGRRKGIHRVFVITLFLSFDFDNQN